MNGIAITIEQLDDMKHAIGYNREKVKRGKYHAYRNYYADQNNESWECLVKLGYANSYKNGNYMFYSVSKQGIILLETILDIKIFEVV